MIGWKVKCGYVTGVTNEGSLNNLSNITFLDNNTIFSFCSGFNVQFERDEINNPSDNNIQEYAESLFNFDIDTVYVPPYFFQKNDYGDISLEVIKSHVPSTFLAYANTISFLSQSHQSLDYGAIYIPTLKRVLCGNWVYKVNDDGSLTRFNISRNSGQLGVFRNECSISSLLLTSYSGPEDLIDSSKYKRVTLLYSFSGTSSLLIREATDLSLDSNFRDYLVQIFGNTPIEPDIKGIVNPYDPGGTSDVGGGNGTFDGDSDQISDSSLPTLSSADTGFTRLYSPTLSQVQSLARYLWTDESIVETLWNVVKRYFEDPMQAFISFSIVPVPVPIAGQEEFKVLFIPTGVMLNTVANQFVDVDCGTFELKEYYGSALDYSPNTKVSCYLPYIGTVSLNTDDVMGRILQVKYRVDICSGSCVAKILVDGNVIYQYPGCCSVPIPFSSSDFSSYGSAIISAVKTGVAVAAAGAGMPELGASVIGMDASQQSGKTITMERVETARNPKTGRQITTGTEKVTKEISGTEASLSGIAQTGVSNTANSVTASKTIVERSGSFSGNSGYLGVRRPYLIIERPRMCMPANYQQLNGFPSMITLELGSCKGFTRVQQVQLTGFYATNPEQAEILQLLKAGVIL